MADVAPSFGWYGKSPATGDFVSRRLSKAIVDRLDAWLQSGMMAVRAQAPLAWEHEYATAPIWNAVVPGQIVSSRACLAVVAPSRDRVGRRFPFCMIGGLAEGETSLARITSLPDYCASLAQLVEMSIRTSMGADELDQRLPPLTARYLRAEASGLPDLSDIAAVLGDAALGDDLSTVPLDAHAAFPWPDLVRTFDPAGPLSYWWSYAHPGRLHGGFTHAGPLDATLFVTLFGGSASSS